MMLGVNRHSLGLVSEILRVWQTRPCFPTPAPDTWGTSSHPWGHHEAVGSGRKCGSCHHSRRIATAYPHHYRCHISNTHTGPPRVRNMRKQKGSKNLTCRKFSKVHDEERRIKKSQQEETHYTDRWQWGGLLIAWLDFLWLRLQFSLHRLLFNLNGYFLFC